MRSIHRLRPQGSFVSWLVCGLASAALLFGCQKEAQESAGARISVGGDQKERHAISQDGTTALYQLPDYSLVSHRERAFGSKDLVGKIYVANFFFTSCSSMCPPLIEATQALQASLKSHGLGDVQIVSFTVDPENATSESLRLSAQARHSDRENWTLVTGAPADVTALITKHFHLHVGDPTYDAQGMVDIAHTGHFVVVDEAGRVRAFVGTTVSPSGQRYGSRKEAVPEVIRTIKRVKTTPDPAPPS